MSEMKLIMENWRKLLESSKETQEENRDSRFRGERDILGRASSSNQARWDREDGVTKGEFTDYQIQKAKELGMHPRNIPKEKPASIGRPLGADGQGWSDNYRRSTSASSPGTVKGPTISDMSSTFANVENDLLTATSDFLRKTNIRGLPTSHKNKLINTIEREINQRAERGDMDNFDVIPFKKSEMLKLTLAVNQGLASQEQDKSDNFVLDKNKDGAISSDRLRKIADKIDQEKTTSRYT